ncbi:DUF1206 domain-containing protein [Aquihabitans sp. G128]|nr:DUF1206 domain-containing protein [Aquihabitans sp. G128]QXC59758.1 DUF1206 domain-containing protein [Aquihabitans sp. G128]
MARWATTRTRSRRPSGPATSAGRPSTPASRWSPCGCSRPRRAGRPRVPGGSGGSGESERHSTAVVLSWPLGPWLVVAAGLVVIGTGLWNGRRAVTRSFLDALDLGRLSPGRRRAVELLGVAGYLARFGAFALVGWFLVDAGLQHDPDETRGLDQALRELATTSQGPRLLLALAVGLVLFGVYRVLDATFRKSSELTHA